MINQYPVLLALIHLLSILLSVIGLFQIARILKRRSEIIGELAYIGGTLIVAGELLIAVGHLLSAALGKEFPGLMRSQLLLMAPGTICFAWALYRGLRDRIGEISAGQVWLLPLFLNAGMLALTAATKMVKGGRAWLFILFGMMTLGSIAAGLQLAWRAMQAGRIVISALFLFTLMMSLTLNRVAGDHSFTGIAEWVTQISNTISQGVFALAAFKFCQAEMSKLSSVDSNQPS